MNNLLEYKGYRGTVEYSADDGLLYGRVLDLPDTSTMYDGDSMQSLYADFMAAVDDYIEHCTLGEILPSRETAHAVLQST